MEREDATRAQWCRLAPHWFHSSCRPLLSAVRGSPAVLDGVCILAALVALLLLTAALSALGFGVGFDVFPIGEDNNWVDMLQRGAGAEAARLFWAHDHRNPLSPWWYIAARGIILHFDAGLLFLRFAMAVVLAASTYCMVVTVAGYQARKFALAVAILIISWMANRFPDQIVWIFHGALAASLLSIAAYARFIEEGRRHYRLYALSLLLWFIAFATYTIQCGAVLAIGYLALRRSPSRRLGRVRMAALETIPYLVLFGLFLLLWQTTMGPLPPFLSLHFRFGAMLHSLGEGVFTSDVALFYERAVSSPSRLAFMAGAAAYASAAYLALRWREGLAGTEVPAINGRLLDVFAVVALIAAPTVAVESSSNFWPPGLRWPMIYQLTNPVLMLGGTAALVTVAPPPWRARLWNGAVALAVALGALFSLGCNRLQVEITASEKFIRDSMLRLVGEDLAAGLKPPTQILLMLEEPNRSLWRWGEILSPTIARAWFRSDDISFRLVRSPPSPHPEWASWWPIRFGSNAQGVSNAKIWGGSVPYEHLRILSVSGRNARRVMRAERTDFVGYDVEWNREGPITLPGIDPEQLCPLVWPADREGLMEGWSVAERDAKGPLRWTVSPSARVSLPANCHRPSLLRVVAVGALSTRNIERVRLTANGRNLDYRRSTMDGDIMYEAQIDLRILTARPLLDIEIGVDALDSVPGAARKVGIAIRRVEIVPSGG